MPFSPRRGLPWALVAAAVCALPAHGRAMEPDALRDFSTVGRLVARKVEGRTVVVVPIAGPIRVRLSEPFRVSNRWRLYLTIEDARLSVGGSSRARRPEGVLALSADEVSGDVRIAIEVARLGDYGARRSEEGLLLWIDEKPRVAPGTGAVATEPASPRSASGPGATSAQPDRSGGGSARFIVLAVVAAAIGAALRYVRRNGMPEWASDAAAQVVPRLRNMVFGKPEPPGSAVTRDRTGHASMMEPVGRSAEIGDAFRVEPEKPPSGIAALAATEDGK